MNIYKIDGFHLCYGYAIHLFSVSILLITFSYPQLIKSPFFVILSLLVYLLPVGIFPFLIKLSTDRWSPFRFRDICL